MTIYAQHWWPSFSRTFVQATTWCVLHGGLVCAVLIGLLLATRLADTLSRWQPARAAAQTGSTAPTDTQYADALVRALAGTLRLLVLAARIALCHLAARAWRAVLQALNTHTRWRQKCPCAQRQQKGRGR